MILQKFNVKGLFFLPKYSWRNCCPPILIGKIAFWLGFLIRFFFSTHCTVSKVSFWTKFGTPRWLWITSLYNFWCDSFFDSSCHYFTSKKSNQELFTLVAFLLKDVLCYCSFYNLFSIQDGLWSEAFISEICLRMPPVA